MPHLLRRLAVLLAALAAFAPVEARAAPLALLDHGGAWVAVEGYGPNAVHVVISPDKAEATRGPGYGLLKDAADSSGMAHATGPTGDDFTTAGLRLHVDAAPPPRPVGLIEKYFQPALPPLSLAVTDAKGRALLNMTGWALAPRQVGDEHTYQVSAAFGTGADEHYYGLGQNQEGVLDLRGRTLDCRHWYEAPHGETVCIPFMVSSKGYGIVWDNTAPTMVTAGVNGRTLFKSTMGERVSFFVITGDTPDAIYATYARLTGRTPLPPKAAFGLIQSKARYASQAEVETVADTYRRKGYPLDMMVVDWFYWSRLGQLDIDPAQFPHPDEMNAHLHAQGVSSMISFFPRFESSGRYFNELSRKGYLLKDRNGATVDGYPFRNDRMGGLIDATNPDARKWYWEHIRDNVLSHGFDYPWLDATEPNLVPDDYMFSIGSGERFHNLFPLLHVEGVSEGLRAWRPDRRPLILARAAYLGSQRTGALFWSSDIPATWEALVRQVPTGLNMAASGISFWGNDIGGWLPIPAASTATKPPLLDASDARDTVGANSDYPELFTRWFEYGVFLPTLRVHGLRKNNELWSFGREAERILADYDRLRYRLLPYIYTQAHVTNLTGAPMMRPLWMDFPHDPAVANLGSEYMFGPALLVAPVTEQGQTSKDVYLPAGADWYDYWSKERVPGGRWRRVETPIDRIPVFVRAGSVLPIGSDISSTAQKQSLKRIEIYPGADGEATIYDDDGASEAYRRGAGVSQIHVRWNEATRKTTVTGADPRLAEVVTTTVKPAAGAIGER